MKVLLGTEVVFSDAVAEREVDVDGLKPNTPYTVNLTVRFEGGFGPPLLLATTTPEDGESAVAATM